MSNHVGGGLGDELGQLLTVAERVQPRHRLQLGAVLATAPSVA